MSQGNPLRDQLIQFIQSTITTLQATQGVPQNIQGSITQVNDDGTVVVIGADGNSYNCGSPIPDPCIGLQVTLVTAGGVTVAIGSGGYVNPLA